MDWNAAIEKNREALKRVVAMLVAMAGLATGDRQPAMGNRQSGSGLLASTADCRLPIAVTLPRHLHRAVLRLLRPAEAAARRLIIVAARGIVVTLRPVCPGGPGRIATFTPSPSRAIALDTSPPLREGEDGSQVRRPSSPSGTGGEVPSECEAERGVKQPYAIARPSLIGRKVATPGRLSFPLFDPLYRFRRHRPRPRGVPRISIPGVSEPFRIPPPPSPDNAIDATRLALRLAALARVLDDLPRAARRFARWRAARDAAGTQNGKDYAAQIREGRARRVWPLRPGRPPGHSLAHGRQPTHEIHDILDVVHGLAFWALESPDTS